MDLFKFAMDMELEGQRYYEGLAAAVPVAGLKNIFTWLAAEERKHYATLSEIKAGVAKGMLESSLLDQAKGVFRDLVPGQSLPAGSTKDLDAYRHALEVEQKSVELYEGLAGRELDAEVAQLLLRIADEERKHLDVMRNIYDFVLAPQNFIAWGEFSNLREL